MTINNKTFHIPSSHNLLLLLVLWLLLLLLLLWLLLLLLDDEAWLWLLLLLLWLLIVASMVFVAKVDRRFDRDAVNARVVGFMVVMFVSVSSLLWLLSVVVGSVVPWLFRLWLFSVASGRDVNEWLHPTLGHNDRPVRKRFFFMLKQSNDSGIHSMVWRSRSWSRSSWNRRYRFRVSLVSVDC